jgi:hypothetical protein
MRHARAGFLFMLLTVILAASGAWAAKKPAAAKAQKTVAPRTQEMVAFDFIYHLLTGNRDSVAMLFEKEAHPHVTQEVVDHFQGQFKWLYNFIGGDFEEFFSGHGAGDSSFFREYRMSNESNKRYPLILIHVVFPDSVTPVLIGAQVKSFLGGKEKRVTGDQTWNIEGRDLDLHSIIVAETGEGNLMAVQFYDEDTADISQETIARYGVPLIREALARGYLDSARTVLDPGQTLKDEIGVVFIRKDRRQGLTHYKVGFRPEDYATQGPEVPKPAAAKKKKTPTR